MITKTSFTALIFLLTGVMECFSQTFTTPATGLMSPETMKVTSVSLTAGKTIVSLSVENRRSDGTFCADRNIYIINPDGSRLKLQKAEGIPQCPDSYKFKKIGETLQFSLIFPALKPGTGWFDLVEECDENCFSVFGILLNDNMSRKIDKAAEHVDKGEINAAIGLYKEIINGTGKQDAGITGSLYSDLVSLLVRNGYTTQASEYYKKLVSSDFPKKQFYINNLTSRGIKF